MTNLKNLLGQNFLINKEIAKEIVGALEIKDGDLVVEVGPGKGALTDFLLEKPVSLLLAYEKDYKLVEYLREKYHSRKNIKIVHGDVLRINHIVIPHLMRNPGLISMDSRFRGNDNDKNDFKLISNLPYSITSFFINKFFIQSDKKPSEAVLMVQKEVAERLCSKPGEKNRGILTVLLQACCRIEYLFEVSRTNFSPTPAVDSAVIRIIPQKEKLDPKFIFLVKAGFSSKRQKLANPLSKKLNLQKDKLIDIMKTSGLNENARAEDLSTDEWKKLTKKLLTI